MEAPPLRERRRMVGLVVEDRVVCLLDQVTPLLLARLKAIMVGAELVRPLTMEEVGVAVRLRLEIMEQQRQAETVEQEPHPQSQEHLLPVLEVGVAEHMAEEPQEPAAQEEGVLRL